MNETSILKEPLQICICGEKLYTSKEIHLMFIDGRVKYVCNECLLKHKAKRKNDHY